MSHFNFKSFAFYAVAIGSVVVLFKVVSTFGETLKAPSSIEGNYRLISESLPKCLQSYDLLLNMQQSGIYLNGALLALDKNTDSPKLSTSHGNFEEKLSLSGLWKDRNLTLLGSIDKLGSCGKQINAEIQAVVDGDAISGEITISSAPKAVKFMSRKEAKKTEEIKGNH